MLTTDLADYLVKKGVPFGEAHHISGQCVAASEKTKVSMDKFSVADFQKIDSRFGDDVLAIFDYEHNVEQDSAQGGTARKSVEEQIAMLKKMLS